MAKMFYVRKIVDSIHAPVNIALCLVATPVIWGADHYLQLYEEVVFTFYPLYASSSLKWDNMES